MYNKTNFPKKRLQAKACPSLAYPVAKLLKKRQSATFHIHFLILFIASFMPRHTKKAAPVQPFSWLQVRLCKLRFRLYLQSSPPRCWWESERVCFFTFRLARNRVYATAGRIPRPGRSIESGQDTYSKCSMPIRRAARQTSGTACH